MAKFPAFPLWTDAYLGDTSHLTVLEHGVYLMLLIHLWRAPKQRVPNDDIWLARRLRMTPEEVASVLRPLLEEFCQSDGNWITQKRLSTEFSYLNKRRRAQSVRAKSRWDNDKNNSAASTRHRSGNAASGNALSTPTPTPLDKEEESPPPPTEVPPVAPPDGVASLSNGSKPVSKKGTRLPDNWMPTFDNIAYAKGKGLTAEQIEVEAENFRDWWLQAPGAKGLKLDWAATWRTWARRSLEHGPRGPPPGTTAERVRKLKFDG